VDFVNSDDTYYLCDNVYYLLFPNKGLQAQKDQRGMSDVTVDRLSKQTKNERNCEGRERQGKQQRDERGTNKHKE
jgi:hypothetical protein